MPLKSIEQLCKEKKLQAQIKRLELEQLCLEMKLKLLQEELNQPLSEQEPAQKKKSPISFKNKAFFSE